MKIEITSLDQFKNEVANGKVLVDFYATWCGPCKMVSPIIDQVESEHPELKVLKVDVDEVSALAEMFGIQSIPTLLVFENGERVNSQIGFAPKPMLEKLLGY